jgi:prepilin-type processing-associated H-X9-DG protein
MFGEGIGGAGEGARDFAWGWMGVGNLGTKFGLGRANMTTYHGTTHAPNSSTSGSSVVRFSARHPASVNFAFGDGSVRGVRYGATCQRNPASPDWYILQQISGRKDGLNANPSALID